MTTAVQLLNGRRIPLHKLGVDTSAATTVEEALAIGKADFSVSLRPILFQDQYGQLRQSYDYQGVVRDDNDLDMGIVGKGFHPTQNSTTAKMMSKLLENSKCIKTVGLIDGGRRVWMLFESNRVIDLGSGDTIVPYLLAVWGHDGSISLKIQGIMNRIFCSNALTAAFRNGIGRFVMRHTKQVLTLNENMVANALGMAHKNFDELEQASRALTQRPMGSGDYTSFINKLFVEDERNMTKQEEKKVTVLQDLFHGEQQGYVDTVKGTQWGAYNAVVEYLDYHLPWSETRLNTPEQNKAKSILFGGIADKKQQAWDLLTA